MHSDFFSHAVKMEAHSLTNVFTFSHKFLPYILFVVVCFALDKEVM